MDNEIKAGETSSPSSFETLRVGLVLREGIDLNPVRVQFLKETRLLFPLAKITIFTHTRFWSEFDLFDYFDDVAAVEDGNGEALRDLIRDRDPDLLVETTSAGISGKTGFSDGWAPRLGHVRSVEISAEIAAHIHVKNSVSTPSLENTLAALGTVAVGPGELHRNILAEIQAQPPLDRILLSPWPLTDGAEPAWNPALWTDIGQRLLAAGHELVIAGAADHHAAAVALRSAIGETGVQLLVGRAGLRQTAILLGRARAALTAPGLMARLAALSGTPLVVLDLSMAPAAADLGAQAAATVKSLQSLLSSTSSRLLH